MISAQLGIIPGFTRKITHSRWFEATVFVEQYSDYCYSHLMRGTSYEETLRAKEAYERLSATHRARVCAYRAYNGSLLDPLFKEEVQICGQKISYCGVGSHHQNAIVEFRIKELALVSQNLLIQATR